VLARARARARASEIIASLMAQAKANVDELFDISYVATRHLIKDKPLLNELIGDTIVPELTFMKRFGTLFGGGGVVGAIQPSAAPACGRKAPHTR